MNKYISELTGSLIFKDINGNIESRIDPGPSSINFTGSVNISGSNLIVDGGNVTQRLVALESGSGGAVTVGGLTLWSASINIWTGSTDTRLYDLEQTQDNLTGSTADLEATASNHSLRIADLEVTSSTQQTSIDVLTSSKLVSSSQQIFDLGFISASTGGIVSSSAQISELGFITGSAGIFAPTGSVYSTNADLEVTGSLVVNGTNVLSQSITYVTGSQELNLNQIEVADYDDNVAVTYTAGKLKFIFGTPDSPSSVGASLSGFSTDRFNQETDAYSVNGSWNNGGYTLISASLYEGSTLLQEVYTGTSITFSTTTSGSHTYKLNYTASSPLDGTIYSTSRTTTGTVSKSSPGFPTISTSATVQLGASSNQIEQGATGSIAFSTGYGSANSWEEVSLVPTPSSTPLFITGSATGSSSVSISLTSNYQSPAGDNDPQITTNRTTVRSFSKIRSVRYGADAATSFTEAELLDLANWDTTLGGSIGTIDKGTTYPSGEEVTISWSGDKYHYIVFDSSRSNLTNITTNGFGVIGQFSVSTVGSYKIYRTNTLQAGGAGSSITYNLT